MITTIITYMLATWGVIMLLVFLHTNLAGRKQEAIKWYKNGLEDGTMFGKPLMDSDDFTGGGWFTYILRRNIRVSYEAGVADGLAQRIQRRP